jgi:hypothetical protein
LQQKYLQGEIEAVTPSWTQVVASANDCCIKAKFVLFFHQQNQQQAGFLVDIRSLANNCFLYHNSNCVLAHSSYSVQNKFLILPVDGNGQ